MKFLAMAQTKDSYYMLPPETRMQTMVAGDAYIRKYLKSGKCKEIFETADLKGSVSIWEVGSSEEAARLMMENPWLPFTDFDIQPLVEYEVAMKAAAAYLKRLRKKK